MTRVALFLTAAALAFGTWLWWTGEKGPITGRVVDPEGRPIPHAKVHFEREFGEPMFPGSLRWARIQEPWTSSTEDGTFSLTDPGRKGRYRLEVTEDHAVTEWVEVERGATGVEVILEPAWEVSGEVTWDEELGLEACYVEIWPAGLRNGDHDLRERVGNGRFGFTLKQVPAGDSTLVVLPKFGDIPIFRMTLRLEPGGGALELGTLDLRGKVNRAILRLTGHGEDDPYIRTTVLDPDGMQVAWETSGVIPIYFPSESIDLSLRAEGYQEVVLEDVRGDMDVPVTPGYPIELFFMGDPGFPEDVLPMIELHPSDGSAGVARDGRWSLAFSWNGFPIPAPGDYKIMVRIADIGTEEGPLHGPFPQTYLTTLEDAPLITVEDRADLQSFDVPIDQKTVRKAVTRLRHLDWPGKD